eukprot:TRINITY_DN2112_c1_g2_i3.p1 TRINITY_DN2112_c1_g2~~TRINITY_DN2112_c1_g2_i3.p1  ORF type:complete len:222 (+),score=-4.94 TRINITY_DN2112_c1_g2_i3:445-1110(+)
MFTFLTVSKLFSYAETNDLQLQFQFQYFFSKYYNQRTQYTKFFSLYKVRQNQQFQQQQKNKNYIVCFLQKTLNYSPSIEILSFQLFLQYVMLKLSEKAGKNTFSTKTNLKNNSIYIYICKKQFRLLKTFMSVLVYTTCTDSKITSLANQNDIFAPIILKMQEYQFLLYKKMIQSEKTNKNFVISQSVFFRGVFEKNTVKFAIENAESRNLLQYNLKQITNI